MPRDLPRNVRRAALVVALAGGMALLSSHAGSEPALWDVDESQSRLVIHVYRSGVLSAFAHDHHFVPGQWTAEANIDLERPETLRVKVDVRADSLVDRQPALSEEDRQKVERQVRGPEILDAARHPVIRFEADRLEVSSQGSAGELRGTLVGKLTLHGHTRPIRVPVAARHGEAGFRVNGNASFKQSDFGIEPYETALGGVSVKDRVVVQFALRAAVRR